MADIRKIDTNESFDEFVKGDGLHIVKIGTDFCGPCKVLEGILQGLSNEEVTDVALGEVNADDDWFDDKVTELKIRGVPVLIAYNNGEEKERIVGAVNKDTLLSFFGRNK